MAIASPTAAVPGVTAEGSDHRDFCMPPAVREQHIDDATWQHFALALACAGSHDTGARTGITVGRATRITQQWLALAHMLQQTGHAGELAAPLGLLVVIWLTGGKLLTQWR